MRTQNKNQKTVDANTRMDVANSEFECAIRYSIILCDANQEDPLSSARSFVQVQIIPICKLVTLATYVSYVFSFDIRWNTT